MNLMVTKEHLTFITKIINALSIPEQVLETKIGSLNNANRSAYENYILNHIKNWDYQISIMVNNDEDEDENEDEDEDEDEDHNGFDAYGCELRSESDDPDEVDQDFIDDTDL